MSLMSIPRKEVVYDVDNSSEPAKITLTFRDPPEPEPEPEPNNPDPPMETRKPTVKRIIPNIPKLKSDLAEEETTITPKRAILISRRENMKKRREEFVDKGIIKALHMQVEAKVQSACMSTDHILVQKRTRLRELLLAEEVAYATEYITMCQQANANRQEELRIRACELKQKNERERQIFSDEKLRQRKMLSCDAARPVLTQKILMEVKRDQLWQMKEKYALEEAKREEDRMYHDLMMKNMMALKENDEEIAKLAWIRRKEAQNAFTEQMKWKEQKEKEEKQLKEYERLQMEEEIRLYREENDKDKEVQRKKKEKIKTEFHEFLARERETKERRRREEEEIETTFCKLLKIEEEKEKAKILSDKERLKREMDIFIEKSKELKLRKEEEDRKFDEMLQELNEKKKMQKDEERKILKAAREELFYNVLRGREEQIKEKQEAQRRAEELAKQEIELLSLQIEQQRKIREDFERRCVEERNNYRCELRKQMEEVEETRRRKKEEEEEYIRKLKADQEKEIEEVKEMLQNVPIGGKDHPLKVVVTERQPRYMCPYPCPR